MDSQPFIRWALLVTALILITGGAAHAANLTSSLDWSTIGGGGTSAGESFDLRGTIGQTASDSMAGGSFTLHGGYRAGDTDTATATGPPTATPTLTPTPESPTPATATPTATPTVPSPDGSEDHAIFLPMLTQNE